MLATQAPYAQYFDTDGSPLDSGAVFFGAANQNPETNPVTVYWDAAGTQPALQPIRTLNGYLMRTGTPAAVYATGDYSVTVRDKRGALVAYARSASEMSNAVILQAEIDALYNSADALKGAALVGFSPTLTYSTGVGLAIQQRIPTVTTVAALRASSSAANVKMMVTGYSASGDGGGGLYLVDASDGTSTDNGGTVIVAADGARWKLQYTGPVSLKQFGAKGDNSTIDTAAIQAAVTWATATVSRSLWAPSGTYVIDAAITKAQSFIGINMAGDGFFSTIFKFTAAAGLVIVGGSGQLCNAEISGIGFTGPGSTCVHVEIQGQCGQKLRRCRFDTGLVGIRYHNFKSGDFTEYCVGDTCDFSTNCQFPVQYKKTSGNVSFNGSGLVGQCTISSNTTSGVIVKIDNGCQPYNAPFFAQVWGNSNCTVIQDTNTALRISFYGQINLERFAGTMTLATSIAGFETPFAGKVISNNEFIRYGTLYLCDAITLTSAGSLQTVGARWSKSQAMATGANTVVGLPYSMAGARLIYSVWLNGTNYNVKYEVKADNYSGGFGSAPVVASLVFNNTAGYGAPTFSVNASNQLVITNAGFPASGVVLYVDVEQVGQDPDFPFIVA